MNFANIRKYPIVLGILLWILNFVGYITRNNGSLPGGFIVCALWCISIIVFCVLANIIFGCFDYLHDRKWTRITDIFKRRGYFLVLVALVIVVFWTPVYFGLFPGMVNYDAPEQMYQYINNSITEHHPVLHTLLFGKIISVAFNITHDLTVAVCIYFIFQLSIFLLCTIYVFDFIYEINAPIWICVVAIFYYAVFPPSVAHFMCVTKDNYFSMFLVCCFICNYRLFSNPDKFYGSKSNIILWLFFVLGTLLFRNNAIYAIIILLPVWMIYAKKRNIKYWGSMVAIVAIVFLFYKCVFVNMVCVEGIDKREMMSVPAQQLARVYNFHYSEMSKDQISTYEHLFSKVDTVYYYEPLIADASKAAIDMDFYKNNVSACRKLYFSMMMKYPADYIYSFLKNTYGYWYLYPELILTAEKDYGYIFLYSFDPFSLNPKIKWIYDLYDTYFNGYFTDSGNLISCLAFPGLYFDLLLICLFYSLEKKNALNCWLMAFIAIIWLTFLLGPVVLVRYVMFLFLLVPILLVLVISDVKQNSEQTSIGAK